MNITTDELLLIVGAKEAELFGLRRDNTALRAECEGWKAEAMRLVKAEKEAPP